MVNVFSNYKMIVAVAALLMVSVSLSACDPLRKKFVRQKKQAQESQDFIPVLEPQEYLPIEKNTVENYKQHYSLIKVWYKDLWTGVEDENFDRVVKSSLKQIYDHIEQMKPLLKSEKSKGLDQLVGLLKFYESSLNQPRPQRNYSRIQSDLRAFDRMLRGQFREDKLKGSFIDQ